MIRFDFCEEVLENRFFRCFSFLLMVAVISVSMILKSDDSFQTDSEGLVIGSSIVSLCEGNITKQGMGLVKLEGLGFCDDSYFGDGNEELSYDIYISQIGLQGMMYSVMALASHSINIPLLRAINAIITAAVMVAIIDALICCKKYVLGFSFFTVSLFSTILSNFAPNLYWCEFLCFVPLFLGILLVSFPNKRKIIYVLLFMSVSIKCLCGYEYISTIMLYGLLFVIVEWICDEHKRTELTKVIVFASFSMLLGFLLVYTIHAFIYGQGNLCNGLAEMKVQLVERRTYGNAADFNAVYSNSLNASVFEVINKYMSIRGIRDAKINFLCFVVTCVVFGFRKICMHIGSKQLFALFCCTFVASMSWIVLAKSHSYIHMQLNFVVFYMGWIQVCVCVCADTILQAALKLSDK